MNKDIRYFSRAKRKTDGKWIYGNLLQTDDGIYIIQNYIPHHTLKDYEVDPETICLCTGKEYMDSEIAYEGDIFESQASGDIMVLRFGTFQAYCPVDRDYMDSVGFYAECKEYPDMPIGDLQDYALKKGNIFDNPELMKV